MAQSYAGFIVFYAWLSNSFPRPASKRAVVLALTNALSQLGNVAGSYVWQHKWEPTYRNAYGICIATCGLSIMMCFGFRMELVRQNKKLAEAEEAELGGPLGETQKGYRYML